MSSNGHRRLRALAVWPPSAPTYFNAGHRMFLFSTAAYLRTLPEVERVDVLDAGVLNQSWMAVERKLWAGRYDVVLAAHDLSQVEGTGRLLKEARQLLPACKLIAVGRLSMRMPGYFARSYPELDYVVSAGDPEAAVAGCIEQIARGEPPAPLPGVWAHLPPGGVRGEWALPPPGTQGPRLTLDQLPFPDPQDIPFADYDWLYGWRPADDRNMFCGVPGRRELVVVAARGCPINCDFCEVPGREGLLDRRVEISALLDYVRRAQAIRSFDYVAMYAPTFTLKSRWPWVLELCDSLEARGVPWRWKCTTMLSHLSEELVLRMGRAGCIRISVGLETLDPSGQAGLPKGKRSSEAQLSDVAGWCQAAGVELNCLIIAGLPGTSLVTTRYTANVVRQLGARARFTRYADWSRLRPGLSEAEIDAISSHRFIHHGDEEEVRELYNLLYDPDMPVTAVMERIPTEARPPSSA